MGDMSGGNNHTISQQDYDFNNGDMSSRYGFINSHTISQRDYSSTFTYMY